MKSNTILLSMILVMMSTVTALSQSTNSIQEKQSIGIVISSNDPETDWNAFRLATYAVQQGDSVSVFLLGKGVESESVSNDAFDVKEMMETFVNNGGVILACGTCLRSRNEEGTKLCPVSTLGELYQIIKTKDIVLNF